MNQQNNCLASNADNLETNYRLKLSASQNKGFLQNAFLGLCFFIKTRQKFKVPTEFGLGAILYVLLSRYPEHKLASRLHHML